LLKKHEIVSPEEIQELLDIPLLGIIPEESSVVISANQGKPFAYQTQGKLGQLFLTMAKRITHTEIEAQETTLKSESLWNKVKKSFIIKK